MQELPSFCREINPGNSLIKATARAMQVQILTTIIFSWNLWSIELSKAWISE